MAQSKKKSFVILIPLVLIVLAVIAYFGYNFVNDDINGNRKNKSEYTLNIEAQDFQYEVGLKLRQGEIIKNETVWSWWMDKNYPDFTYINGEYYLTATMSYEEIAEKLQNPDVSHKSISVCIPEGYNVFDIADALEDNGICTRDDFLNACRDKSGYDYDFLESVPNDDNIAYQLEGFLFPATYDLAENSQPQDVICKMLDAFEDRISDKWLSYCKDNDMSLFELVTLASIVEKETLGEGVAEDIASVFINRLNINQQLQSDVTIFYGNELRENGFDDNVVFSYNTYKCKALPSGAVCNPGVANIDAVVNHNDTEYYYFFSDLENEFHFAKDYNEFEKLKKEFPWE